MNVKPNPMSARDFLLWLNEYFDHKAGDDITQGDLDLIGANLKRAKNLLDAMEENLATSSAFTAPPPADAPSVTFDPWSMTCAIPGCVYCN